MVASEPKIPRGFTLIEILLVIGIIAVLATVVIVALDPATRFQDARDSRRISDIQSISSTIQQYIIDNQGSLPSGLGDTEKQIGSATSGCDVSTGECAVNGDTDCVDLSASLNRYLKTMPYDPADGSESLTGYSAVVENGIVTIKSCGVSDLNLGSISR